MIKLNKMGKSITIVWVTPDICMFLYGFNKKNELVFRTSVNIEYLQKEIVKVDEHVCYTDVYSFPIGFLAGLGLIEE